jgi:mono/diheme cytochrome c family protein
MRIRVDSILVAFAAFATQPAFSADADNGSRLGQRWCASCHVVSSSQSKGSDATPSFASIAQRADFNAEKLAFFLLHPHPIMPNMTLTRAEAEDLAAYIATQR